jgi:Zn-dependent protease with chaperone function
MLHNFFFGSVVLVVGRLLTCFYRYRLISLIFKGAVCEIKVEGTLFLFFHLLLAAFFGKVLLASTICSNFFRGLFSFVFLLIFLGFFFSLVSGGWSVDTIMFSLRVFEFRGFFGDKGLLDVDLDVVVLESGIQRRLSKVFSLSSLQ